jgi:hypothetical protein
MWQRDGRMGKYDPLFRHLATCGDGPVEMTFDEIERLVGSLPASATRYAAWWSNEGADSTHVQSAAWMNAGREVESVDRTGRRVRFSDARWRRSS